MSDANQLAGLDDAAALEVANNFDNGRYPDGWKEDTWEKEFEQHPAFMSVNPETGELPPMVEALQQLKYNPEFNTKLELAKTYKEDGNDNFRHKKYKWAVTSYTVAIKQECEDQELNSQLYGNRSASHFFIGNYRSSLNDALKSFSLNSENIKSASRIAQCYYQLKEYRECIDFCDKHSSKIEKLKEWKDKAEVEFEREELERIEREKRDAEFAEEKQKIEEALEKRSIKFRGPLFESVHPGATYIHVKLNEFGELVWPVIFVYPEHNQTDFLEQFNENDTFYEQFHVLFGDPDNKPPWDSQGKYTPDSIKIGYAKFDSEDLVQFSANMKLKDVLSSRDFVLLGANPTFSIGEIF